MGADFCESTCGGVRCEELCGVGDPDPHTRIAGKRQHWAVVENGFFAHWYDGWLEPSFTGPVAEGLRALGSGLRAIGEAWESRARSRGITVYGSPPALYATVYQPAAWTTPELSDGLPEVPGA